MRKRRTYKPRRGVRFTHGRTGGPAAGYIGGTITDIVTLSGSVVTQLAQTDLPYTGSLIISRTSIGRSVTFGRDRDRRILNRSLLGIGQQALGPAPSVVTARSYEVPSWANAHIANQSSVVLLLATGSTELRSLNYATDGFRTLEDSPAPVSIPQYISKEARFRTIVVKHTASFFDTVSPLTGTVPSSFAAQTGVLCSTITGTNMAAQVSSENNPATISVSVPVSGRLVDIKVWVELTHLTGGAGRNRPLAQLGLSLRNPNLSFGHAHPLYNDTKFQQQTDVQGLPCPLPNFYKDTFLLWEGPGLGPAGGAEFPGEESAGTFDLHGGFNTSKYPSWGKDRGMRTIFTDGARTPNPRHLYNHVSPSGNYLGAPNAADSLAINSAYGCNVPWTTDRTAITAVDPSTYIADGSPPKGWLNGPAQTADVNEWPTTGSNLGTNLLRPVYPLLDPIFVRKVIGTERTYDGGLASTVAPPQPDTWRGLRPGLYGSEISGTWQLLIVNNSNGASANDVMPLYFRQVRLEITYDSLPSSMAFQRRAATRRKPGKDGEGRFLYAISGTDNSNTGTGAGTDPDYFRTLIYTTIPGGSSSGRTFDLRLNSGAIDPECALLYRLTGALADIVGSAPSWLLNNPFGVPAIPESSASLVTYVPYVNPQVAPPQQVIVPQKTLDGPTRLRDVARSINPPQTLVQLAADFASGSST